MSAEGVTKALGGQWFGRYGVARCPAHQDQRPSLSISESSTGLLLLYCHAGCEFGEIVGRLPTNVEPIDRPNDRHSWRHVREQSQVLANLIGRLWNGAFPIGDTQGEAYFRERAIVGRMPVTLRFAPGLRHPVGGSAPGIIARVDTPVSQLVGLHRTYLDKVRPQKSQFKPAKAMLGPCRGGAVRLRSGRKALVVCEGIETGLSLCDALDQDFAVWAALSTAGIKGLQLPPQGSFGASLIVATDGDAAGQRAGLQLAGRASRFGWSVEILSAPEGLDFNDLAQGVRS